MTWRSTVTAITVAALLAGGCGDDQGAPTLADIAVYDLDAQPAVIRHQDRPLVINFFAESCAPCVAEMPAFEAVFQAMGDRVDFVGVSEDATAAAGRRIVEATGVTYRTLWDGDGTAFGQFEALGLPTTVFVGEDGALVDVHTGALTQQSLEATLRELVDAE